MALSNSERHSIAWARSEARATRSDFERSEKIAFCFLNKVKKIKNLILKI